MPATRGCVAPLDELNCNTHTIEVNYLTQILFWVRNALLRLFQEKCHTDIPSEDTAGAELLSGISLESEQFQTVKLL